MISVYQVKPKFQQLLKPVLVKLHSSKITANQITISAILLSAIIGFCFWNADDYHILYLALPVGLFTRMALNALDGMMARTYAQQSKLGEVLNELGDVVSDLLIYFPLLKFEPEINYLVVIFLCLTIINEFAGVLGKTLNGERRYDGPMGKSDRAMLVGLYGLLGFFNISINSIAQWIFAAIILLLMLSTFLRIKRALALSNKQVK